MLFTIININYNSYHSLLSALLYCSIYFIGYDVMYMMQYSIVRCVIGRCTLVVRTRSRCVE